MGDNLGPNGSSSGSSTPVSTSKYPRSYAEVNLFVSQTDASAVGDYDDLVVEGIIDVRQPGVGTRGSLADLGRALHLQSFVRPLAIENFQEGIEAGLLLQEVLSGRLGGFFFQAEWNWFVGAIL